MSEPPRTLANKLSVGEVIQVEQVMGVVAAEMNRVLIPMVGSMLVVVLVGMLLLSRVRNRFVRGLGGYAAVMVWVGWMAAYFKTV